LISPEAAVRAAVGATVRPESGPNEEGWHRAHVTLRTDELPPESAVTREAQKGYGLLVLGIAKTVAPHGGFQEDVARIAAMYEGPLAVVVARGPHLGFPLEGALNVLVPVRGDKVSRRAAEVALALARTSHSSMTAFMS
jgi:hypothetical protein